MNPFLCRAAVAGLLAVPSVATQAKPVLVAETPGHTRFLIEDTSLTDLVLPSGKVRQAQVLTRSAPDPHLTSGQVAAEGVMQFDCTAKSYRQWSTTSIRKDGSRQIVVSPLATRAFTATRDGSFERQLLQAACTMRKAS